MKNGIHPEGYAVTRKKTNADRIRSMTDEELLDFLCSIETYEQGSAMTIEGGHIESYSIYTRQQKLIVIAN